MDWRGHHAVILGSDDWGMGAWAPDVLAYERYLSRPFMQNTWSKGTLERPVLFQPNYVVAPPDYEAIKEDGSTKYYNTGLTGSLPSRWQRGDLIGTAREGMDIGVWYP